MKVDINGSHPFCKYILLFILTHVYNAILAFRMLQPPLCSSSVRTGVDSPEASPALSYRKMRKENSRNMSFRSFVRRLVDGILRSEVMDLEHMPQEHPLPRRFDH